MCKRPIWMALLPNAASGHAIQHVFSEDEHMYRCILYVWMQAGQMGRPIAWNATTIRHIMHLHTYHLLVKKKWCVNLFSWLYHWCNHTLLGIFIQKQCRYDSCTSWTHCPVTLLGIFIQKQCRYDSCTSWTHCPVTLRHRQVIHTRPTHYAYGVY